MPLVRTLDKGHIDYKECWDFQETLFQETISEKLVRRNDPSAKTPSNKLIFCEHPHVFTLGKSGSETNLLASEEALRSAGATYYRINRGGDITYHGPGQLVMYPIFDLDQFFTDIHRYMRYLEEAVLLTLFEFGIKAERSGGFTGVWLDTGKSTERKICAMGVRSSRWVTMHGVALNINTDLSYFNHIVPCGLENKSVTSMQKELGHKVPLAEVREALRINMANVFGFDFETR